MACCQSRRAAAATLQRIKSNGGETAQAACIVRRGSYAAYSSIDVLPEERRIVCREHFARRHAAIGCTERTRGKTANAVYSILSWAE